LASFASPSTTLPHGRDRYVSVDESGRLTSRRQAGVFSTANLRQTPDEISGILGAVESKMRALANGPQIHSRRVRVRAVGRLERLPPQSRSPEAAAAVWSVNTTQEFTAILDRGIHDRFRIVLPKETDTKAIGGTC